MRAVRFLVSGRVQGVFFRAGTHERAQTLGVRGFARNLPDGRVEVLAIGGDDAIEALAQWLRQGPPRAQVDEVERMDAQEPPGIGGFEVR